MVFIKAPCFINIGDVWFRQHAEDREERVEDGETSIIRLQKNNRQKRLRTRSLVKSSALSEVSAVEFQKGVTMTAGNASAFFGSVPRFQERLVFGSLVFVTAGNEI